MSIALGRKIKSIRQSQDMSQQELADRLEYLNQSQVSKIENGDRKATAQDLIGIAKALGVSVNELIN
ncbi:helix-turn-helix domain-containing protein [Syntrophomonas erecta subsp. sporosyntropha]